MALKNKQILQYNETNTQWENVDLVAGGITNITVDDASTAKATFTLNGTIGTLTIPNRNSTSPDFTAVAPIVLNGAAISFFGSTITQPASGNSGYIQTTFTSDIEHWNFLAENAPGRSLTVDYRSLTINNSNSNKLSEISDDGLLIEQDKNVSTVDTSKISITDGTATTENTAGSITATNGSKVATLTTDVISLTDGTATITNTATQTSYADASTNQVDITANGVSITQAPQGGSAATNKTYVDGTLAGFPIVIS